MARASIVALNGDFFLAGCTTALTPVFYTTPGAYQNLSGNTVPFVDRFGDPDYPAACQDGFVTRFDPNGNILYSTLLGGPGSDAVRFIQTDSEGRAFVALDMDPQPPQTRNIVLAGSRGYGMARLSPDGSRVDFLTQYDFSFVFAPPPLIPTGLAEVIRRIAPRGRKGGGSDILLFEDTLPDDRLPRIDAITIRSDTQAVDYELEIRGEGFDVGGEFLLDGVAIPVVFVSDSVIRTGTFRTRAPLENLFSPNQIRATYKLTIRNRDGVARSVTVLLRPPADAPPSRARENSGMHSE